MTQKDRRLINEGCLFFLGVNSGKKDYWWNSFMTHFHRRSLKSGTTCEKAIFSFFISYWLILIYNLLDFLGCVITFRCRLLRILGNTAACLTIYPPSRKGYCLFLAILLPAWKNSWFQVFNRSFYRSYSPLAHKHISLFNTPLLSLTSLFYTFPFSDFCLNMSTLITQYATSSTLCGSDEEYDYPADYPPFSPLYLRDEQEAQLPAYLWTPHGLPTSAQPEQDEDNCKYPPHIFEQMDDDEALPEPYVQFDYCYSLQLRQYHMVTVMDQFHSRVDSQDKKLKVQEEAVKNLRIRVDKQDGEANIGGNGLLEFQDTAHKILSLLWEEVWDMKSKMEDQERKIKDQKRKIKDQKRKLKVHESCVRKRYNTKSGKN